MQKFAIFGGKKLTFSCLNSNSSYRIYLNHAIFTPLKRSGSEEKDGTLYDSILQIKSYQIKYFYEQR